MKKLVSQELIDRRFFVIRGQKVMIDRHLAELYQVDTRSLNQAVKRNKERFPEGFLFQLTRAEREEVITICDNLAPLRYARTLSYAFTEQGVAMLSSVLKSRRAIQVNIQIMQTFVRLRAMIVNHIDLARRLDALERKYDAQFKVVFDAIREMMIPPERTRCKIGFLTARNP